MKKIGFVVPWYHKDIRGGAEQELRGIVTHLKANNVDLEIITTCVKEFTADWTENYFKEGVEIVDGIPIRRFKVRKGNMKEFHRINAKVMQGKTISYDEEDIFIREMVNSPDMYDYLREHSEEYHRYVFIPYMFGTTYYGILACPFKSILIPCLHDEAYAYFRHYRETFRDLRGIIFHARPEMELANKVLDLRNVNQVLLGEGVETDFEYNADRFRKKYNINEPYIIYAGRKDEAKNIYTLIKYFGEFTRRNPDELVIKNQTAKVCNVKDMADWKDKIDVMILCGGSATDLPEQTPECAKYFNVIDSFDTHARIPEHFANVDASAKASGHIGIISVGWDPGMFSLNRLYGNALLPEGNDYTFWGKGVSQGHSDAIRRIAGVKDAKQYTIPVESALEAVRACRNPELTTREKHTRECFVVAEEGADKAAIETAIKTMPNYFADYDTTVHFISEEELKANHSGIPHGGFVLRSGVTGWNKENKHIIEYSLKLDSNPEFTSSVLIAYARAAHRLANEGASGCKTVFDIAPAYLVNKTGEELRASML